MQIILHPAVHSDLLQIAEYYESVTGTELADDFYNELCRFISDTAKNPERFSVRENGLRRVNLPRFPYHFLFRISGDVVQILVVRHHRRHPSFGIDR